MSAAHFNWQAQAARYLAMAHRCKAEAARCDYDLPDERRAEAVQYHEKRAADEQDRASRFDADARAEAA